MKTNSLKVISMVCIFFVAFISNAQQTTIDDLDIEELIGLYEGYNEENNSFIFIVVNEDAEDEEEEEESYAFIFANEKIQKKYDLLSNEFEGKPFLIKYTVEVQSQILEDGTEDFFEIYTIVNIDLN